MKCAKKNHQSLGGFVAPQVGLEPTTLRLTAECSAIELLRHVRIFPDANHYIKTGAKCQGLIAAQTKFTHRRDFRLKRAARRKRALRAPAKAVRVICGGPARRDPCGAASLSSLSRRPGRTWRRRPSGSPRCWRRPRSCPPCRIPWRRWRCCGRY